MFRVYRAKLLASRRGLRGSGFFLGLGGSLIPSLCFLLHRWSLGLPFKGRGYIGICGRSTRPRWLLRERVVADHARHARRISRVQAHGDGDFILGSTDDV